MIFLTLIKLVNKDKHMPLSRILWENYYRSNFEIKQYTNSFNYLIIIKEQAGLYFDAPLKVHFKV